jgi:hypothetical protein
MGRAASSVSVILTERVVALVEVGLNHEPGRGGGGGDQLDDGSVGRERLSSPVHGDEAEQAGSILCHFDVPGGMWHTVITSPMVAARRASCVAELAR